MAKRTLPVPVPLKDNGGEGDTSSPLRPSPGRECSSLGDGALFSFPRGEDLHVALMGVQQSLEELHLSPRGTSVYLAPGCEPDEEEAARGAGNKRARCRSFHVMRKKKLTTPSRTGSFVGDSFHTHSSEGNGDDGDGSGDDEKLFEQFEVNWSESKTGCEEGDDASGEGKAAMRGNTSLSADEMLYGFTRLVGSVMESLKNEESGRRAAEKFEELQRDYSTMYKKCLSSLLVSSAEEQQKLMVGSAEDLQSAVRMTKLSILASLLGKRLSYSDMRDLLERLRMSQEAVSNFEAECERTKQLIHEYGGGEDGAKRHPDFNFMLASQVPKVELAWYNVLRIVNNLLLFLVVHQPAGYGTREFMQFMSSKPSDGTTHLWSLKGVQWWHELLRLYIQEHSQCVMFHLATIPLRHLGEWVDATLHDPSHHLHEEVKHLTQRVPSGACVVDWYLVNQDAFRKSRPSQWSLQASNVLTTAEEREHKNVVIINDELVHVTIDTTDARGFAAQRTQPTPPVERKAIDVPEELFPHHND